LKLHCIALLVFGLAIIACEQPKPKVDDRFIGLDVAIDSLVNKHHAAGLAVAVIEKGETIYSKGFGYRDYERKLPVTEHTVFGIGSCTKAFTATVLGILESEGKLSFEDKPKKFLPALQFSTPGMNDSVEIKNLLSHSTGLASWPSESSAVLFITPDKYELVPRLKHITSASGVGQKWIYNNLLYSLAGMVAERASGQNLEDNWKSMIFKPLEMHNTYGDVETASKNTNFSYGYAVDSIYPHRVLAEDMSTRGAGGAIYSTISDMTKWMQVWLNDGRNNNQQIIPQEYLKEAQDTLVLLPNNPSDSIPFSRYYGYGWFNWNHKGYKRSEHSGGTSGYVSNVVLYPEQELGIVVLSNQTTSSLPSMVNNRIVERLYPALKEKELNIRYGEAFNIDPITTPTIQDSEKKPSFNLSKLVGTYEHPGFGQITISLKGETLYADFPFTRFRLEYVGDNTFIDHHTVQMPHVYWNFLDLTFHDEQHGEINKMSVNVDQEPVVFKRI